jgi:hypothetical protein
MSPLIKGKSQKTVERNVEELKTGNTFARTAAKSGKKKAVLQAYAIAKSNQRKSK